MENLIGTRLNDYLLFEPIILNVNFYYINEK